MNKTDTENIIKGEWERFAECTLPAGCSRKQYDDMWKAFFSGAFVVTRALEAAGQPNVPELVAVALMQSLFDESTRFLESTDPQRN